MDSNTLKQRIGNGESFKTVRTSMGSTESDVRRITGEGRDDPLEMKHLAPDSAYREQLVKMTQSFWQYARDTEDTPMVGTLYPALRLVEVGPFEEW